MIDNSEMIRYAMHGEAMTTVRSFKELCEEYETDKDKYAKAYEDLFHMKHKSISSLFEIGVQGGGSLWLWREYFPRAEVIGLDCRPYKLKVPERSKVFEGYQQDGVVLRDIIQTRGPFDVIVDDGGHIFNQQKISFEVLGEHASIYIIEDVGPEDAAKWLDVEHKSLSFYKAYESSKTPEKMLVWQTWKIK